MYVGEHSVILLVSRKVIGVLKLGKSKFHLIHFWAPPPHQKNPLLCLLTTLTDLLNLLLLACLTSVVHCFELYNLPKDENGKRLWSFNKHLCLQVPGSPLSQSVIFQNKVHDSIKPVFICFLRNKCFWETGVHIVTVNKSLLFHFIGIYLWLAEQCVLITVILYNSLSKGSCLLPVLQSEERKSTVRGNMEKKLGPKT